MKVNEKLKVVTFIDKRIQLKVYPQGYRPLRSMVVCDYMNVFT